MRNLPFLRPFSHTMILTGFVAVLVGYASSVAIILQALETLGLDISQISHWLMMLGIGMGITTIGLSLYYKTPILTAWSTPGIALLATSLTGITIHEAVGIFIFSSALMFLCGITGLFAKLMSFIPRSIASAMLAGILLKFDINLFISLESNFILCISMLVAYIVTRRLFPLYAIIVTLLVGIIVITFMGEWQNNTMIYHWSLPAFIMPHFSLSAMIGIGIPFFIVSLTSQNAPAIAILQANGYPPRTSILLIWTSLIAILLVPWGGFSICIAAITASICMSPEVDPDPDKRYFASTWAGIFYIIAGIFGGAIVMLFTSFPPTFIQILAGLALLTTFMNSLYQALSEIKEREAAILCFLLTASGITLFGISSAFWGLIVGVLVYHLSKSYRS